MDIYDEPDEPFDVFGPEHLDSLPDLVAPMWEHDPAHTPRTGVALRMTREALGMSAQALADYTGVSLRTAQRWETAPMIPGWVETAVRQLTFHTDMWANELIDSIGALIQVRRNGWRIVNNRPVPEAWWHALVGRALLHTPLMPVELDE